MIDLTPVEALLNAIKTDGKPVFTKVEGVLSVKSAVDNGINEQTKCFVMPLNSRNQKVSGGSFIQYQGQAAFAVVIGMRSSGHRHGGDNRQLAELIHLVTQALLGQTIEGALHPIELGNGGLLPVNNNSCVFWQQEFTLIHYTEVH